MYRLEDAKPHSVWRHVKTDSLYLVLGVSRCSTNGPREGELSVVYYSMTYQRLCDRKAVEFLDGRFVPVVPKEKS